MTIKVAKIYWTFKIEAKSLSVCLGTAYLTFCWNFFYESMLKYTCTLKKWEKVGKKKWGIKKLYIKFKR